MEMLLNTRGTIVKVTVLGLHSDACFVLIRELRMWKVESEHFDHL